MEINLAQATLHFLTKGRFDVSGDEAEVLVAVRNHWKQEAEKAMTPDVTEEEEDAA